MTSYSPPPPALQEGAASIVYLLFSFEGAVCGELEIVRAQVLGLVVTRIPLSCLRLRECARGFIRMSPHYLPKGGAHCFLECSGA